MVLSIPVVMVVDYASQPQVMTLHIQGICRYSVNILGQLLCFFRILLIIRRTTMFRWRSTSHRAEEPNAILPETKINELRASLGPLSGRSLEYCTDSCLARYLEVTNWNLDKSKKLLEETLIWRSTFKPDEIRWPDVAMEGETGKAFRADFHDQHGRTVLILRPGMQNTKSLENQIRHLVYLIENAVFNLPDGQEQTVWLIDFTGWSISNNVPIKTARDAIHIIQNHYPERLAVAFLYNPPRIFETFWKVVKYFMDTRTFQKVKFVYPEDENSEEIMKSYFDVENLPMEFGGKATLNYDHEEFSRRMSQDDIRLASLRASSEKLRTKNNSHSNSEEAPETAHSAD